MITQFIKLSKENKKTVAGFFQDFFTSAEIADRLSDPEYLEDLAKYKFDSNIFSDAKKRQDWEDCHEYCNGIFWDLDYKHGYRLPF